MTDAPGWPGIPARWTSSDKSGIGTALSPLSRVWFTLSHGILNEIYYPRVDQACTRDCGLVVTDGTPGGFFSEEKRDTVSELSRVEDGVPVFVLRNVCRQGRYTIENGSSPTRGTTWCCSESISIRRAGRRLRLFVLLAPHLVNGGAHNTAWPGSYKGEPMLFAEGDGTSVALACSRPWLARSVGFVGVSDGWQDLSRNGSLTWQDRPRRQRQRGIGGGDRRGAGRAGRAGARLRALLRRGGVPCPGQSGAGLRPHRGGVPRPTGATGSGRSRSSIRRGGIAGGHNFYRVSTAVLRPTIPTAFPAASSQASPFRGAPIKATTTWAATIWYGRAIWWRRPAA